MNNEYQITENQLVNELGYYEGLEPVAVEALTKQMKTSSFAELDEQQPHLCTSGVNGDCYPHEIVNVTFFTSGKKKGEIKTIDVIDIDHDGSLKCFTDYVSIDGTMSDDLTVRIAESERTYLKVFVVKTFKSFWTKNGEFKCIGEGSGKYIYRVRIGYAKSHRCMER